MNRPAEVLDLLVPALVGYNRPMSAPRALSVLLTTLVLSGDIVAGGADNWPQFRGSRAGIAADDPALPDAWSATENIVWKIDVPGRGWSSPIVWGDHVFVTAAVNTKGTDEPLKPVPSYTARSFGGPMSGREIGSSTDPHRWVLYDIDFKAGKIRWESSVHTGVPVEPKQMTLATPAVAHGSLIVRTASKLYRIARKP